MGKIKTVLFDLDGTLLPMNQDKFVQCYFGKLYEKVKPYGYEKELFIGGIWRSTGAMLKNDGTRTNEEVFWSAFTKICGERILSEKFLFDEFYLNDFPSVSVSCGHDPNARVVIDLLKEKGVRTVLATNPIFPAVATENRIKWAGLSPDDFEYYTTYENSTWCKPNAQYYLEILNKIGADPKDCLMVGNDVSDDMPARELGMDVFLLTDCLINADNRDISEFRHGGFAELIAYLNEVC